MAKRIYLENYFCLLLSQFVIGINIVSFKYLASLNIPTSLILFVRFALASILLFLLSKLELRSIKKYLTPLNKKDYWHLTVQALTAGALFNVFMLLGLHYTHANQAGIITSALPSIIALLSWLWMKDALSKKILLCVGLATIGLVIISAQKFLNHDSTEQISILGDALVFISLMPEASYYVLSRMHPIKLPVFLLSALINGINALVFLPALFFFNINWHQIIQLNPFAWLIMLVISISSALFYIFWSIGSKGVDNGMAFLSTAMMPISTVIVAWLALGELITASQFIGMGLVLASIFIYASK